ncbi:hypothetical protein HYH02_015444, partial [Chlamydomonas schloesseri]
DIVTDMDEELEERVMRFHEERDMAELGRALGNTLHHWLAGTTPVPEGPRQLVLDLQRLGPHVRAAVGAAGGRGAAAPHRALGEAPVRLRRGGDAVGRQVGGGVGASVQRERQDGRAV